MATTKKKTMDSAWQSGENAANRPRQLSSQQQNSLNKAAASMQNRKQSFNEQSRDFTLSNSMSKQASPASATQYRQAQNNLESASSLEKQANRTMFADSKQMRQQNSMDHTLQGSSQQQTASTPATANYSDDKILEQINKSIDTATNATVSSYQKQIDSAPAASRALYDSNAVDEAINRKKVQESMANMGMTDSGLSSSMQTAMAIQKSNADHQVRQQERAYVQGLETAISNALAQGESQKYAQAADVYKASQQRAWQSDENALNRNWQSGENDLNRQHDVNMQNAQFAWQGNQNDLNRQHDVNMQNAQFAWQGNQNDLNRQHDITMQDDQQTWLGNQNDLNRTATANSQGGAILEYQQWLMDNQGYSLKDADAISRSYFGVGNDAERAESQNYITARQSGYSENEATIFAKNGGGESGLKAVENHAQATADSLISGFDLGVSNYQSLISPSAKLINKALGLDIKYDGKAVAEKVMGLLSNNANYAGMSNLQQQVVKQKAIAKTVVQNWGSSSDEENKKRLKEACDAAGIEYDDDVLGYYNDALSDTLPDNASVSSSSGR